MQKSTFSQATYDFLVIGTGLSGLNTALKLAPHGQVALVAKSKIENNNSWLAQGGIASVIYNKNEDSFDAHIEDTIKAGAGICDKTIVEHVIKEGPQRINDLVEWGVQFDKTKDEYFALTKEGGHSYSRILHVGDFTGQAINEALIKKVLENENIELIDNHLAIDLIKENKLQGSDSVSCLGAFILDLDTEHVYPIMAKATVLATGGAGKAYLYTSNWSGATGDGIAMAYRAGAEVKNLEFMQFHPTCLYHPEARNFLISEALRGEGALLKLESGQRFMTDYHESAELAPRDIVARSIDNEMKKNGLNCVYLDITMKDRSFLEKRFPNIFSKCLSLGIDISKDYIPVVPAAHYLCGGVTTNINGESTLKRLYVVGETSFTGLHGANRLASNSLLECLVFAHNTSQHIVANLKSLAIPEVERPSWVYHELENNDELIVIKHMWEEIRHLMWNYVGIVRSNKRLERARHRMENINQEIEEYYRDFKIHPDLVELRNIALFATLTIENALKRKNSIGIHYNIDLLEA